MDNGQIALIDDSEVSGSRFLEIVSYSLGEGEAECIANCEHFGFVFATDDRRARQVGKSILGEDRIIGSLGLLRLAVEQHLITASTAVGHVEEMRATGGFVPSVTEEFFLGPEE